MPYSDVCQRIKQLSVGASAPQVDFSNLLRLLLLLLLLVLLQQQRVSRNPLQTSLSHEITFMPAQKRLISSIL
jgi:hypothetical protein